ncbi:MAG: pyridoxamine 5'-phosphate oxidase family protein [Lachnospiraceae bacterium]|nr:pyridoxamine 5'-phosphate oxidase family protein [Lachnospiraceae bacterium]
METVERVAKFLDEAGTYFLATVDGDQPRVRPFGTVLVNDGKLYIQTGKVKDVSKQIAANPKVEISASKGSEWIRIAGELVNDDNRDVKVKMLEKMPGLAGMYSPDDDNMQMLYFKNAVATFCSFAAAPETVKF